MRRLGVAWAMVLLFLVLLPAIPYVAEAKRGPPVYNVPSIASFDDSYLLRSDGSGPYQHGSDLWVVMNDDTYKGFEMDTTTSVRCVFIEFESTGWYDASGNGRDPILSPGQYDIYLRAYIEKVTKSGKAGIVKISSSPLLDMGVGETREDGAAFSRVYWESKSLGLSYSPYLSKHYPASIGDPGKIVITRTGVSNWRIETTGACFDFFNLDTYEPIGYGMLTFRIDVAISP